MTAQQDLADIANMGSTNIRVHCTVTPIASWNTTQMRDTYRYFSCIVNVHQVGKGPIYTHAETGKNLDVVVSRVKTELHHFLNTTQGDTPRKKLKLKLKRSTT